MDQAMITPNARERRIARLLSATLIPHTTSVHNVDIIAQALADRREACARKAEWYEYGEHAGAAIREMED